MLISVTNIINMLGALWSRFESPESNAGQVSNVGRNRSYRSRGFELDSNFIGEGHHPRPPPFVQTELGSYEGYFMKVLGGREIYAFEGVPFAEPPERFKAPEKKRPFAGNFSAKSYAPECVQTYYGTVINPKSIIFGKEDCLTCNIYTPQISTTENFPNFPVLIYFFGGSFSVGSSNDYGPAYLLEKDIILVNCNYRVGVLGFLSTGDATASGNWGLKDCALAVDWVHTHIRPFGGDPQKIVLTAQSAGAVLTHLLALSPLFIEQDVKVAGMVLMSGNALVEWAVEDPSFAVKMTKKFAGMNFCPTNRGSEVMVNCLRKRNYLMLEGLTNFLYLSENTIFKFRPVIEPPVPGAFITDSPENIYKRKEVYNTPIIFSVNSQDTDIVLAPLTRAFSQLLPSDITQLILSFSPMLLEFKDRVDGKEEEVLKQIVEFYGGLEYLRNHPRQLFKAAQDRMFTWGLWKSLRLHAQIAPAYGMIFGYTSKMGIAGRIGLNPDDFGVPHAEDQFYIFNRTDIPPITKDSEDYAIVQLFQSMLVNFANTGSFKYTSDNNEVIDIITPVDPRSSKFDMFVIEKGAKVVEMELETNITRFWNSLSINRFPSLTKT